MKKRRLNQIMVIEEQKKIEDDNARPYLEGKPYNLRQNEDVQRYDREQNERRIEDIDLERFVGSDRVEENEGTINMNEQNMIQIW